MNRWSFLALTLLVTSGCVAPGPFLRVATASQSQLRQAADQDVVWYEFQKGDVVPFHFVFFGALEGGAEAAPLRAMRRFFLVMRKDMPVMVSFDGESFADPHASQSIITVLPGSDASGGQVGWFHYLGESQDPREELERFMKRKAK